MERPEDAEDGGARAPSEIKADFTEKTRAPALEQIEAAANPDPEAKEGLDKENRGFPRCLTQQPEVHSLYLVRSLDLPNARFILACGESFKDRVVYKNVEYLFVKKHRFTEKELVEAFLYQAALLRGYMPAAAGEERPPSFLKYLLLPSAGPEIVLPSECVDILALKKEVADGTGIAFLKSGVAQFVDIALADEFKKLNLLPLSTQTMLQCLSSAHGSTSLLDSYERMEFLGDTILKVVVSTVLFKAAPGTEGRLSDIRGRIVSNKSLIVGAIKSRVPDYANVEERPPEHAEAIRNTHEQYNLARVLVQQERGPKPTGKPLADIIEAVAGALYLECGVAESALFFMKAGLLDGIASKAAHAALREFCEANPNSRAATLMEGLEEERAKKVQRIYDLCRPRAMQACRGRNNFFPPTPVDTAFSRLANIGNMEVVGRIEKKLNYVFRSKELPLIAFRLGLALQGKQLMFKRLEFLGGAIFELLVTEKIYSRFPCAPPSAMTALRHRVANNRVYARLLLHLGLADFLEPAGSCGACEQCATEKESEESWDLVPGCKEPQAVASAMEAMVGAVFLDSNFRVDVAQAVFSGAVDKAIGQANKHPKEKGADALTDIIGRYVDPAEISFREGGSSRDRYCDIYLGEKFLSTGKATSKITARSIAVRAALDKIAGRRELEDILAADHV